MEAAEVRPGQTLVYDDGRPGHQGVLASVLAVDNRSMVVQFEDRADTTTIAFEDRGWMDYLKLENKEGSPEAPVN